MCNFHVLLCPYKHDIFPRYLRSQRDYLEEEVTCLEDTLRKRRAELREADRLLQEREADLSDAKREVPLVTTYSNLMEELL